MANTRDIRRRIKSIKNTAQITKAMQLVAASKMKKAQDQALAGREYAELMNTVLVNLKDQAEEDIHPLLEQREGDRELFVVITSDKGLCGGLNTNLLRKVSEETNNDTGFVSVGRKGRQFLGRSKKDLKADFTVADPVPFADAKVIAKYVTNEFLEGNCDRVRVGFTNFVTTLTQEPFTTTLLPITAKDIGEGKGFEGMGNEGDEEALQVRDLSSAYTFEPSPERVFAEILPLYVNFQIYQMLLEARASEHSSRMVAMKGATDNAEQIIKDLTLEYNKLRQAAITNELLEITTAMKALE